MAKAVLAAKSRYSLLSLGSTDGPIFEDKDGYLNKEDEEVRRCYMRIAARIHPDKLVGFAEATNAFQALVRAYELCCKPDLRGDESDDSREEEDDEDGAEAEEEEEKKAVGSSSSSAVVSKTKGSNARSSSSGGSGGRAKPSAAQSKHGSKSTASKPKRKKGAAECHRTGVRCPRCHSDWGSHLKSEGREALYTSFMRGQCQVHCLSCLFEFGCNTASHHCPHCTRRFEYRPAQSESDIECPNDKQSNVRKACGKCFRVAIFTMSVAKQAEDLARRKQEEAERRKREASKEARASRGGLASRYGDDAGSEEEDAALELGAFIVSEDCPRCGKVFTSGHAEHLRKCKGKKGGGSGRIGGGGGGAVSKRKRSSGGGGSSSWMVGSYDEDDKLYREPKKPKAASKAAASAKKAKAKAAKQPAGKKQTAKAKAAGPAKKKRRKQASDSDSNWSDSD